MRRFLRHLALKVTATLCKDYGPKIVYYHDMGCSHTNMGTAVDLIKAHVAITRSAGFNFVDAIAHLHEPWTVHICFDDGFRGILDHVEWFVSEELHPTVFIPVGLIGQHGYLTWPDILELQRLGFHFEGHTWSHRPLTDVPKTEWDHELRDSRRFLEDKLGKEISCLCFPCGYFSDNVIAAAQEAGYRHLVVSYPGCVDLEKTLIPRHLVQSFSVNDYRLVLQGALSPFRSRYIRQHYKS